MNMQTLIIVGILGISLTSAIYFGSQIPTAGEPESVAIKITKCGKDRSSTYDMRVEVALTNTNKQPVVVEWIFYATDVHLEKIGKVTGYAEIPPESTVSDRNHLPGLGTANGCAVKVTEVTKR